MGTCRTCIIDISTRRVAGKILRKCTLRGTIQTAVKGVLPRTLKTKRAVQGNVNSNELLEMEELVK